ncbi:MAG: 3-deoxy-7-phosphoheptulonate synthase [Candidatus Omnitrophota bacterium]|jgi:3-deoxy-7-phosphoheptulonate synthase
MIIVFKKNATDKQIKHLVSHLKGLGMKSMVSKGIERTIIGAIGDEDILRSQPLSVFPGVEKVMAVMAPYKLVSREFKSVDTVVDVSGVKIGSGRLIIMAGPCSIENYDMLLKIAKSVKASGAAMLRGGAFKPRTSPYAFQGLGEEGLKYLQQAGKTVGLPVVTEVMDIRDIGIIERYADMIQIGARNMQNFNLLKEVGFSKKPVLLKRGMMSTIKEWLMSAEYILANGNFNVVLCERGIRTFEDVTRFTMDISAIPVVKRLSHLPIIADPSHATGKWGLVGPIAKASVAAGCDGLMIEVHADPEHAFSDGEQSMLPIKFKEMIKQLRPLAKVVDKTI